MLAAASVAYACTLVIGTTWFFDAGPPDARSGASGVQVHAYATGARPDKWFVLFAGMGGPGHEDHACMFNERLANPTARRSNAQGFIPPTLGDLLGAPGEWQICFGEVPITGSQPGTAPVLMVLV